MRKNTTITNDHVVRAEWNYNKFANLASRVGDIIMYQAPNDDEERPLYVDAEGRMVPVSAAGVPAYNTNGHVIDRTGKILPVYQKSGKRVHIDDIRVAVTGSEITVKDENGNDILLTKNGSIVPTDPDGVPFIKIEGGQKYVLDERGNVIGRLAEVFAVASIRPPSMAENFYQRKNGQYAEDSEKTPHEYDPEIFPIDSIALADRPKRRGVKAAWADENGAWLPEEYRHGRHYLFTPEAKYKYWTSGTESATTASTETTNLITNGTFTNNINGWASQSATIQHGAGVLEWSGGKGRMGASTIVDVPMGGGTFRYEMDVFAQMNTKVQVYYQERSFVGKDTGVLKQIASIDAGTTVKKMDAHFTVAPSTVSVKIFVYSSRATAVTKPRVSIDNVRLRKSTFAIEGVGPRVLYDRPLKANKIEIGIDYSMDYAFGRDEEGFPYRIPREKRPSTFTVAIETDRGDGLPVWKTIKTSPQINDDGKVILKWNGTTWVDCVAEDEIFSDDYVHVMGVHVRVTSCTMPRARMDFTEIALKLEQDLSDLLINFDAGYEMSETSMVVPFGLISSNTGNITFSNHDGRFSKRPKLLNVLGNETNEPNPLYGLDGAGVEFRVDVATHALTDEPEYTRVLTMVSEDSEVNLETASFELKDDSKILQATTAERLFFDDSDSMSAVQVIYGILDTIGFTNVNVEEIDEKLVTSMYRYWSDGEQTVWELIQDICRDTQIAAYFDEYNVLQFVDNQTIKREALAGNTVIWSAEDIDEGYANIEEITKSESLEANVINFTYQENMEDEPDVLPTNAELWTPESSVVLRAKPIIEPVLNDSKFIRFPWQSRDYDTWPYEGTLNVEGELLTYKGKEYSYANAAGKMRQKYINSLDEQKELDKINTRLAEKNVYTGRFLIDERGVQGTQKRNHNIDMNGYMKRVYNPAQGVRNAAYAITHKNSQAQFRPPKGWGPNSYLMAARGTTSDYRPRYYGTELKYLAKGYSYGKAGIAIGTGTNDSGIFCELATTDIVEKEGYGSGELSIYYKTTTGQKVSLGQGVSLAVEKNKSYVMDVGVDAKATMSTHVQLYSDIRHVVLKAGASGSTVARLQSGLRRVGRVGVAINGKYDAATVKGVKQFQKKKGIAATGIMNPATWDALGTTSQSQVTAITASIDGVYHCTVLISNAEMPASFTGGRFGLFTRGHSHVDFEYLYAVNSEAIVDMEDASFFDRVNGGYMTRPVSEWVYRTKSRERWNKGKKVKKNVRYTDMFMDDFGPWAHEVREFDVKFNSEEPVRSSFLFMSNDSQVICPVYNADAFGAQFVLANAMRRDVIVHGEDEVTYGTENPVQQVLMVYGKPIVLSDQKSLIVRDERSVARRGAVEFTIDSKWIQEKEQAYLLGQQILESIGGSSDVYNLTLFPDQDISIGEMISIYAPRVGLGYRNGNLSKFLVTGIDVGYDGTLTKAATVRQIISLNDYNFRRMSEILKNNNNNMLYNQYFRYSEVVGRRMPLGVIERPRGRVGMRLVNGKQAMTLRGDNVSPAENERSYGCILPKFSTVTGGWEPGNLAVTTGHHYLYSIYVIADSATTVFLDLEGHSTAGSFVQHIGRAKVSLKAGERRRMILKGTFGPDDPPEAKPVITIKTADGSQPAKFNNAITVVDMFFRSSNDELAIYPTTGYANIKRP